MTPGLNVIERGVLDAIAEWYRRLQAWNFGGSLSYRRMAESIGADPVPVRWAIDRLVERGLVGVKPGNGARANTYLPALPRRIAASLSAVVADDAAPLF
jgi:hypothetical protein